MLLTVRAYHPGHVHKQADLLQRHPQQQSAHPREGTAAPARPEVIYSKPNPLRPPRPVQPAAPLDDQHRDPQPAPSQHASAHGEPIDEQYYVGSHERE